MGDIPKPRLPAPPVDPRRDRVRFSFRYLNSRGNYSRKAFGKLPRNRRKAVCDTFLRYSRMTLLQFKSSDGVQLGSQNLPKRYKRPEDLSEDVKDQLWQYFRLSGRVRAFGFLLGRTFFVVMIDSDHEINPHR